MTLLIQLLLPAGSSVSLSICSENLMGRCNDDCLQLERKHSITQRQLPTRLLAFEGGSNASAQINSGRASMKVLTFVDAPLPHFISSFGVNVSLATFPTTLVVKASKDPPIRPPSIGTALLRLITPFSPNFVNNVNPTRLFISCNVFPDIDLTAFIATLLPTATPISFNTSFALLATRQE